MAGIKDIAKGRADVYKLTVADLNVKEGWNSREYDTAENQEHISVLAHSIASEGVKEPLTGWMEDGKVYVENGHMRRLAMIHAIENLDLDPETTFPIQISPRESSQADRLLSQITRNSGKPLAPLEMASLFEKLKAVDPEMTNEDIARRAGVTRVHVGNLIELAKMPKAVTKLVRNNSVSASLAIDVITKAKGNPEKVKNLLTLAVEAARLSGKSRATAKHVKQVEKEAEPTETPEQTTEKAAAKLADPVPASNGKSSFKIMAEVRTIIENATHERDESDEAILLVISPEDYAELHKLLDLEKGKELLAQAVTEDGEELI